MSLSIPMNPTPEGIFQSQFGHLPGAADAKIDCARWERLFSELLAEYERLRDASENARLAQIMREMDAVPVPLTSFTAMVAELQKMAEARGEEAHRQAVLSLMRDQVDPNLTREQIEKQIVRGKTLYQLVEEIEREAETGA